jgi:hypothetical protein
LAEPIVLDMSNNDNGTHHVVMGAKDFRQLNVTVAEGMMLDPGFIRMLDRIYHEERDRRTTRKPRRK